MGSSRPSFITFLYEINNVGYYGKHKKILDKLKEYDDEFSKFIIGKYYENDFRVSFNTIEILHELGKYWDDRHVIIGNINQPNKVIRETRNNFFVVINQDEDIFRSRIDFYLRAKIKFYLLDDTRIYSKDELFDIIDENLI